MPAITCLQLSPTSLQMPISGAPSCPEGERLESTGLAPTLALPGTPGKFWASPLPSIGPGFSLCKLGAGVADEISEEYFQGSNIAKIAKGPEEGHTQDPHPGAQRAEAEAISPQTTGGQLRCEGSTRNGHRPPSMKAPACVWADLGLQSGMVSAYLAQVPVYTRASLLP